VIAAPTVETEVRAILTKYLDRDFMVYAAGENRASEEALSGFEAAIGFSLPEQFRHYATSAVGGLYIEVKEEIWPPVKVGDFGPIWSFLRSLAVYGLSYEVPEWMDMRVQTKEFLSSSKQAHVPFLKIRGDADVYCFNSAGDIVRWDHETESFTAIPLDFVGVLEREARELRERKDRKISGSTT
jgi:hypothetical protein